MTMSLQWNGHRTDQLTVDYSPKGSSSFSQKKLRRTRVKRTHTLSGVTDQARKVLDELLERDSDDRDVIKKEIPFSAPTPYEGPSSQRANGHRGYIIDALSPLSDDDTDRVDGGHKRRPSHGVSTVLGDSSPSPVEPNIPSEIVNRKKKTFFVRAKERMRETLRRQEKKPVTPSDEKADLETPSTGKKHTWRLSFKSKKHKKSKGTKENDGAQTSSKKSSWRRSDLASSSATSKDSKDRLSTTTSHPLVTPSEPSPQGNSLPNSKDCDIRVTVPVRSRSTDETRLQPLGPEQQAILRRYLSTAGKSRTSDPRPASLTSVNQGSDSVVTGSGIAKTGRAGHYSLRKNLHLEGLVPSYPTARSAQVKQYQSAPLAVPEESQITPDEEEDIIDGFESLQKPTAEAAILDIVANSSSAPSWSDRPLTHATSKPFNEKSTEEREELYGRIAEQLDLIGDSYCFGTSVDKRKADEKEASVTDGGQASTTSDMRRTTSTSSLSEVTARIGDLVRNTDYNTFQRVVNRTIGSEPGIEQIAAMFRLTKCAVHLVGVGTNAARSIKDMAIRYFEDNFAPWVVDEGGWESVVEESTTDMDLD